MTAFFRPAFFFTANRLSRAITKMAEEEFASTGFTPMYGYLIRLVNGTPGITQKELADKLCVTPSTLTRFVDKLEAKNLVERKVQGKTVEVYPTEKGLGWVIHLFKHPKGCISAIQICWARKRLKNCPVNW